MHGGEEQALALHLEVSLFLSPILAPTYAAASLDRHQRNLTTSCITDAANISLAPNLLQEMSMMSKKTLHDSKIISTRFLPQASLGEMQWSQRYVILVSTTIYISSFKTNRGDKNI